MPTLKMKLQHRTASPKLIRPQNSCKQRVLTGGEGAHWRCLSKAACSAEFCRNSATHSRAPAPPLSARRRSSSWRTSPSANEHCADPSLQKEHFGFRV